MAEQREYILKFPGQFLAVSGQGQRLAPNSVDAAKRARAVLVNQTRFDPAEQASWHIGLERYEVQTSAGGRLVQKHTAPSVNMGSDVKNSSTYHYLGWQRSQLCPETCILCYGDDEQHILKVRPHAGTAQDDNRPSTHEAYMPPAALSGSPVQQPGAASRPSAPTAPKDVRDECPSETPVAAAAAPQEARHSTELVSSGSRSSHSSSGRASPDSPPTSSSFSQQLREKKQELLQKARDICGAMSSSGLPSRELLQFYASLAELFDKFESEAETALTLLDQEWSRKLSDVQAVHQSDKRDLARVDTGRIMDDLATALLEQHNASGCWEALTKTVIDHTGVQRTLPADFHGVATHMEANMCKHPGSKALWASWVEDAATDEGLHSAYSRLSETMHRMCRFRSTIYIEGANDFIPVHIIKAVAAKHKKTVEVVH